MNENKIKIAKIVMALSAFSTILATNSFAKRLDSPANSSNESGAKGAKVIRMWVMPNSPRPVKDLEKILKPFEKSHPGIHVEVTSVDWGAALTKLTTAAISKQAPDIAQLGTTWVGVISATDALEDLTPRATKMRASQVFLPASWSTSGLKGSGKVTSIPWFVDARALYYRTDVFRKLNLTKADVDDYAKFEATLKKIKDAKLVINGIEIEPLGVPGKNDWNVLHNVAPWIWAFGGDFISADMKSSAFTSPASREGVKYFVGLADKGYIPRSSLELNTAQVAAKFNEGDYAMYFDTPAQIKLLSTSYEKGGAGGTLAAQNYDVALYPKGPKGRFTFFGGSNLAIFKSSKNKDEAWQVIEYLTSKEAELAYARETGFIPARKECFDDPYFTKDPKRKIFIDAIKFGRTYPTISAWGPIEPILMRHIGIVWDNAAGVYGKYSPKVVDGQLDKTKKEVDTILKDSR